MKARHTEVTARVDSKSDLGSVVVGIRSSLCAAKRTGLVGTADVELVVVASECGEVLGLNLDTQISQCFVQPVNNNSYLDSVVNIGRSVNSTLALYMRKVGRLGNLVLHTNGSSTSSQIGTMTIKRCNARNSRVVIDIIKHGSNTSPQDDRVRVWISRSNAMSKVQLRGRVLCTGYIALVDFVERDTETRVVVRRTAVVQVLSPARESDGREGK